MVSWALEETGESRAYNIHASSVQYEEMLHDTVIWASNQTAMNLEGDSPNFTSSLLYFSSIGDERNPD